jgi:hypothetical protein
MAVEDRLSGHFSAVHSNVEALNSRVTTLQDLSLRRQQLTNCLNFLLCQFKVVSSMSFWDQQCVAIGDGVSVTYRIGKIVLRNDPACIADLEGTKKTSRGTHDPAFAFSICALRASIESHGLCRWTTRWQFEQSKTKSTNFVFSPGSSCETGFV